MTSGNDCHAFPIPLPSMTATVTRIIRRFEKKFPDSKNYFGCIFTQQSVSMIN